MKLDDIQLIFFKKNQRINKAHKLSLQLIVKTREVSKQFNEPSLVNKPINY